MVTARTSSSRRRNIHFVRPVLTLLLLTGALLVLNACGTNKRMTVPELHDHLATVVAPGMHYTEVESALDSMKVEHSSYRQHENTIRAVWRRTEIAWFHEKSIEADFYFRADGILTRYTLSEVISAT